MKEWTIIGLLSGGGILWAVGGTGFRWARTFLWPVVAGVLVWILGVGILKAVLVSAALVSVCVLPYGDKTPAPVRWVVIVSQNLPCLIINIWSFPFALAAAALSIGLFQATKKWNFVTHKLFEFFAGIFQASTIVISVLMLRP